MGAYYKMIIGKKAIVGADNWIYFKTEKIQTRRFYLDQGYIIEIQKIEDLYNFYMMHDEFDDKMLMFKHCFLEEGYDGKTFKEQIDYIIENEKDKYIKLFQDKYENI